MADAEGRRRCRLPASPGGRTLRPYVGRTTANWVDFLGAIEGWIDAGAERVDAMVDNLDVLSAPNVLLFALAHPFLFYTVAGASGIAIAEWFDN